MSRPDEREVEAVKAVLLGADLWIRMRMDEAPLPPDAAHDIALDVLSALGRVRDARSDDPASPGYDERMQQLMRPARSPQDEDHEAGIETATTARLKEQSLPTHGPHRKTVERAVRTIVDAYLSRVSPSRVGLVAVEDVKRALRQVVDAQSFGRAAMIEVADGFLAEFSRPSTEEPPDPT